jgi:hydrogenase maturation protein HypF
LSRERLQVRVVGSVQGVGFRPFVFRLAREAGLCGWVRNDGDGVTLEVEGDHAALLDFLERVRRDKPASAIIYALDHRFLQPAGFDAFEIEASQTVERPRVWVLPDLATCPACASEIVDPENRRFRYPFTNCTHCGPRFTIIDDLPYDRSRTSMRDFAMCAACAEEYRNSEDRRFHAQPNACPRCGPHLNLQSSHGEPLDPDEGALARAIALIREGRILAVKGLGGYHLIVDARNEAAVAELRKRKRRSHKAFAVMYPDLARLRRHVTVTPLAESMLSSTQAPILLLSRTPEGEVEVAPSVAPDSPYLGVFLPYTPLHLLLLDRLGFPVVATSGNLSDEPIQHDDSQAGPELRTLCDGFLVHDRPIRRPVDDSVAHLIQRPRIKPQLLRRARGYAPLPLLATRTLPPILALGGQMNVTFAVAREREVILSQHLGDLQGFAAREAYRRSLQDFLRLYAIEPSLIVHDLHPDYFTTELAESFDAPRLAVQHHHAHLAACMLEHQLEEETLGVTWDGTGYGPDQTVWGGEFLVGGPQTFERVGSLHPFRLPGGEKAVEQTWRVGLALLYETSGRDYPRDLPLFAAIPDGVEPAIMRMLERGVSSPVTTSMGRLFDGVSALLGISTENTHQAQSAQLLEYAAWRHGPRARPLSLPLVREEIWRLDWREMVRDLVERLRHGDAVEELAAGFHHAIAQGALALAEKLALPRVALTGGVFCNRYLTETLWSKLEESGLEAYVHSQLPPTDGSLAVGQLWVAAHQ